MTVYTWLLEICSTNAFGDFNVAFCTLIFVFQCCMEYGKKPVLTALAEGLTIKKYLDKFPGKYPINRTNLLANIPLIGQIKQFSDIMLL